MKNYIFPFLFAVLLGFTACNKVPVEGDEMSTIVISWGDSETKGAALPAEKKINSLYFYVFDHNGMLDVAHECTSGEISASAATINVKTGNKTVYALANFTGTPLNNANAATTMAELRAVAFDLSNNASTLNGFLMIGSNTVSVTTTAANPCSITLNRPCAKVALGNVVNNLPAPYGTVTLVRAFLCNVVGNQNVAGTASVSTWYNKNGTNDAGTDKSHTITGSGSRTAQLADFTYRTLGESVAVGATQAYSTTSTAGKYFYGFRNTNTSVNNGYPNPFSPTATILMLVVNIKGTEYYYPVALKNGLNPNTDNVVNVTLKGLGNTLNDGPFNKIEKANISASVVVSDWTTGSTYTETI